MEITLITHLIAVAGMSGQEATKAVQVLLDAGADMNQQIGERSN